MPESLSMIWSQWDLLSIQPSDSDDQIVLGPLYRYHFSAFTFVLYIIFLIKTNWWYLCLGAAFVCLHNSKSLDKYIHRCVEKRMLTEEDHRLESLGVILFLDHSQFRKFSTSFKVVNSHKVQIFCRYLYRTGFSFWLLAYLLKAEKKY